MKPLKPLPAPLPTPAISDATRAIVEALTIESHNGRIIAEAVDFSIVLFLGRGEYDRSRTLTLEAARQRARDVAAAHPTCSRKPLIYAVDKDGASALII